MTKSRIPKTLEEKLKDLDSDLFLLREHRNNLSDSRSSLKVIAIALRALICYSSKTEGLLWRLVDELKVDDEIFLHVPGRLKKNHPLVQGLGFYIIPILRGGKGHPQLAPKNHSLKYVVKECESVFAGGGPLTYEYLIKAIAQQMGLGHEDDGLEPALVELKSILINGVEPFIPAFLTVTDFTLEIGERVLVAGEQKTDFRRDHHTPDYGDTSIVLRLRVKQQLAGRIPLVLFHSYVNDIKIFCSATPKGISFTVNKKGQEISDLTANYPSNWEPSVEAIFIFSYCSKVQQARIMTNTETGTVVNLPNLGWLHASDLTLEENHIDHIDFVEKKFLLTYERLLSAEDVKGLYDLPSNGYGLWKYEDEIKDQSPFP